jgi:hypothetical protein
MAIDRLVGADASLYKGAAGSPLSGSGTLASGIWYKVSTISGSTPYQTNYGVGDFIYGNGVLTVTAAYVLTPYTFTEVTDCNSFDFAFSSDEVEVTTLSDSIKKYRKGKTDLSGTVRGINTISEMKKAGSFLNKFLRMVTITTAGTSTFFAKDNNDLFIQGYLQDDGSSGETQAILFGQVEMLGYNLGAAIGDAQSWESSIRFIGADPVVYFKAM